MSDAAGAPPPPWVLVVMGVSASGKTTIGEMLAAALTYPFVDGDALHPPANVAKMKAGQPLTDADRAPWLVKVAARIDAWRAARTGGVVACSALKRRYREVVVGARPDTRLVYLDGDYDLIRARMEARKGHFFPAALLRSQFDDLEPPGPDEHPIDVRIDRGPDAVVAEVVRQLEAERHGAERQLEPPAD